MKQIFIFGASIVYGVGAESLGWADLIKQKLHSHMYRSGGVGERFEVYNLAKPGAEIEFVLKHLLPLHQIYQQSSENLAIFSIGLNNTKAVNTPTNYVSSLQTYQMQMDKLLRLSQDQFNHLICVGYTPIDETKTNPKFNPISGNISYFNNQRIGKFDQIFNQLCYKFKIPFVDFSQLDRTHWVNNCLYQDGVHPNQTGHQLIFDRVWPYVNKFIET